MGGCEIWPSNFLCHVLDGLIVNYKICPSGNFIDNSDVNYPSPRSPSLFPL
jgi:hypothetical protein